MMEHKPQELGPGFVRVLSTQINLVRDANNICCEAGLKSLPSSQTRLICWEHEGLLSPHTVLSWGLGGAQLVQSIVTVLRQ